MSEKIDIKILKGDLSTLDSDGFYEDLPENNEIDKESLISGDGYIRKCVEIQRLLDKYMVAANERLCATVKVYDCKEYSQEFLKSLLTR